MSKVSTKPDTDFVRELFLAGFEVAPVGLVYTGLDGRVIRANKRAAAIFGCTSAELAGRLLSDFYPDLPTGMFLAMDARQHWKSGEDIAELEHQIRRADGQLRWIRKSISPVVDRQRGVTAAIGVISDVTEERETAEALAQSRHYAEDLLETSNAMVVGLGPDGEINVFNDAAAEITGYTREELVGRNWFDTLVPRDRYPQVWQEFERLTEGGVPGDFENPILTKSGQERYIAWRQGEWHREGQPVSLLSVGIDITARKQAEETLEARNWLLAEAKRRLEGALEQLQTTLEAKDRFVATVSHELRTPLSGVFGFASELRDRFATFTPAEVVEFAGHIAQGCATANNLVEDLLVTARLETGDIGLHLELADLRSQALEVSSDPEISSRTEGKSITIKGPPLVAWADPARVRQILRNLIGNAARYGGNRITIVVGTEPNARKAFIRVVDDGPGVPEDLHEVLFQAYQHGTQETGRTESVGLGLYISRTLAQLMDGDLTYRRQEGTTIFELTLPPFDQATNQDA